MKIRAIPAISSGVLAVAVAWMAHRLASPSADFTKSVGDRGVSSTHGSETQDSSSRKLHRSESDSPKAGERLSEMGRQELENFLSSEAQWSRSELRQFLKEFFEEGLLKGNERIFERLLTDYSILDPMDSLAICDQMEEATPFLSRQVFPYEMVLNVATLDPQAASEWVRRHRGKFGSLAEEHLHAKIVKYAAQNDAGLAFQMLENQPDGVVKKAATDIAKSTNTPEHRTAVWREFQKHAGTMTEGIHGTARGIFLQEFAKGFANSTSDEIRKWLDSTQLSTEETEIFHRSLSHQDP